MVEWHTSFIYVKDGRWFVCQAIISQGFLQDGEVLGECFSIGSISPHFEHQLMEFGKRFSSCQLKKQLIKKLISLLELFCASLTVLLVPCG